MSFAECRSLQSAFDTALQNSRTQKDTEVLALMQTNLNSRASVNRLQSHFSARATNKYIPNYKYIKNAIYPANENNTCGYTAACLILNYWHKVKGNVIDSSFLDSNGNLKTTGNTLQDKLLSYGKSNSSWGLTIRDVLIDYCNEYGVAATSTYYVTNFDIFAEVGRNRPVIVFGYFPDSPGQVQSRGKVFHAVTAYGTSTSGLVTKLIGPLRMVWLQSRHIRRWFSRFKYTVCIKLKKEVKYEESLYIFSRNGNYIWNFWLWKERIYCFSFFCIRCCEN